jgi:hypothetical protein
MQAPGRQDGSSPMDLVLQCTMSPLPHREAGSGPCLSLLPISSRDHDNVIPGIDRGQGGRGGTPECDGPLTAFLRRGGADALLMRRVSCLARFFLTRPAPPPGRSGMKNGLIVGLAVMGVGAAMSGEFSLQWWYPRALAALCAIGGGLALLQPAVRPCAGIAGPIDGSARRIAPTGFRNTVAAILRSVPAGHRAGPATAVPERGIMADSPP